MLVALLFRALGELLRTAGALVSVLFGSLAAAGPLTAKHLRLLFLSHPMLAALTGCLAATATYVGMLYVWRRYDKSKAPGV